MSVEPTSAALARRCIPLLDFLALPRTERDIADWATARCIGKGRLRSMLRFLESQPDGGAFGRTASSDGSTSALWRRYP